MKNLLIKFALFILRSLVKSNLATKAKQEFIRAGWCDENMKFKDEMQELICNDALNLLLVFSSQGHSGFSASYCLNLFKKLAKFEPITPLTGNDDEWAEVSDDTYQNKHCGSVFKKGKEGKAYWLNAYVFRDPEGCTFTTYRSRQFIKFPWNIPDSTIIDITYDEHGDIVYPEFIKPIDY